MHFLDYRHLHDYATRLYIAVEIPRFTLARLNRPRVIRHSHAAPEGMYAQQMKGLFISYNILLTATTLIRDVRSEKIRARNPCEIKIDIRKEIHTIYFSID